MFETRLVLRPTRFALETPTLQRDYDACWTGFESNFPPSRAEIDGLSPAEARGSPGCAAAG